MDPLRNIAGAPMMAVMSEGEWSAALRGPLLDALLQASGLPIIVWDLDGRVVLANQELHTLLGYSGDALAGMRRESLFHPDDLAAVEGRMRRRREGSREAETYAVRIWTANKRILRVNCRSTPVLDGDRVVGDVVSCAINDPRLGDALDRQTEQYLELFKRISDAVYVLGNAGGIEWMNRAAERLFGRTLEVIRRTPRNEVLFPEAERGQDTIRNLFSSGQAVPPEIEFPIKRPDGEVRWVRGSLLMERDLLGRHSRSIVIARDVTEERRRERELREAARRSEQEAKIDPLTGLGNRRAFDEAMARAREAARAGVGSSLILMDVDRLKEVNDTLGHAVGDDALRAVAQAVTSRTRAGDEVFRVGGDEFAVLVHGGDPSILAERLKAPIRFREPEPWLTVSAGVASWEEGSDPYVRADARMYEMKRSHRARPEDREPGDPQG